MEYKNKKQRKSSERQLIILEEFFEKIKISPPVNSLPNFLYNCRVLPQDWYSIDLLLGKLTVDELNDLKNRFNESKNRNGKPYWSKSLKKQVHSLFEKYSIPISNSLTVSAANFEALKYLFSTVKDNSITL